MASNIGTAVSVSDGTWTGIVNSLSVSLSRTSIDTTHAGTTTARTFLVGDLYDPGELTMDLHFDSDVEPPITSAAATWTVTFPVPATGGNTTAGTFACSGFMTDFELTVPTEDLQTATATVKLSGAYTWTDSSA